MTVLSEAPRALELLLVEDNPGDVELVREALRELPPLRLSVVHDGVDALAFLRAQGPHAGAPRPDLVLLDLNLPKLDGLGVLSEAKGDDALRDIPIVMLTSSRAASDVRRAYALHVNCYVAKPVDLDHYFATVRAVVEFWGTVALRPRGE
ncbi:MAG: response regulator [Gemmatirosa sp.]